MSKPSAAILLYQPLTISTGNSTHTGYVYSFDPICNFVVLQSASSFSFIKLSQIKDISVPDLPPLSDADKINVGPLPLERLRLREERRVKEELDRSMRKGSGVTQAAQDIFDALSKTLPCRWVKDSIIVLDEVTIYPPYTLSDCVANPEASISLTRVRKVVSSITGFNPQLDGERKRLGL